MATTWSIEHIPAAGGASTFASLAVWGFASLQMSFVNWGIDQAAITTRGGSIAFEAAQFAYLDKLVVWRNGARFAHFWVTGLGASAQRQESRTYTLSGPSWWLAQYAPEDTSNVTVYTAGAYIALAMSSAVAAGAPVGYDSGLSAALNVGCPDVRSAGTILALVQEAARHVPFSTGWWDCSGETPILNAARRSAATAVALAIGTDAVETFGLTPMPELQLKSIRIQFGWTGGTSYYFNEAGLSAGLSGPNRLQCALNYGTQAAALEAAGCGVAERVFADMSTLPWGGAVNLHATDAVDITPIRPGCALNLTGGLPEWSTMEALVQSVVWSVSPEANDCCTLQLGAPDHLGVQDYFELRAAVGSSAGSESESKPVDPSDPQPGTIDDLNGGTGAAPSGSTLLQQVIGGAYTIQGAGPLNGVEATPPRRWLAQSWSGENLEQDYYGNGVCGGSATSWQAITLSGAAAWSAATGQVTSNTGIWARTGTAGSESVPTTPGANLGTNNGLHGTRTTAATSDLWERDGICYDSSGDGTISARFTGYNRTDLANECTESVAIAAQSSGLTWISADYARRTARTGLTFTAERLRYGVGTPGEGDTMAATTGWTPWGIYEVVVAIQQHPITAGGELTSDGEWAEIDRITHRIQADIDGKAALDWQEYGAPAKGYALRAILAQPIAPITS